MAKNVKLHGHAHWLAIIVSAAVLTAPIHAAAQNDAASVADQVLAQRDSMAGKQFGVPIRVRPEYAELLDKQRAEFGRNSLQVADATMLLGHATTDAWDKRGYYKKALGIVERQVGTAHALYGRYVIEAATSMVDSQAPRTSDPYFDLARAYFGGRLPDTAFQMATLDFYEGKMYIVLNDFEAASPFFESAAKRFRELANTDVVAESLLRTTHSFAIRVYENLGQREKSNAHCLALARLTAVDGHALPQEIYVVAPAYPYKLLVQKTAGEVVFAFTIDKKGFVRRPVVEESRGAPEFGEALLEVIDAWRFSPRIKNGQPVPARIRTNYTFSVDQISTRQEQGD